MEELASGETVCKENEAPEEESESTQERTETGGENVESAALPLEGVEEEDMDMEEDMSEDTEDAEEPEEMPEEEPEEISPSADADTEEMKAGKTIRYRVDLANTGDVDLIDIQMTSSFSCPKITQQWEEAEGLDGEGADAEVAELKAGEKRSFYILAPLLNEQEKDLEHKVEAGAKVKGRPEERKQRTERLQCQEKQSLIRSASSIPGKKHFILLWGQNVFRQRGLRLVLWNRKGLH